MANYVIKEMPAGMGESKKVRIYPKMQVYTEFDYDKVVELINSYSPSFSQGTIRGVLDTLGLVMKTCLPMGHTLKVDGVGVFSLSLQFADNNSETQSRVADQKVKYRHVQAKGVNFKVDKKLVDEINKENDFERAAYNQVRPSSYSREERLQRALQHIDKYGFIGLQEYANLNELSRTSASRELAMFVNNPASGIAIKGAASHKCWVRKSK